MTHKCGYCQKSIKEGEAYVYLAKGSRKSKALRSEYGHLECYVTQVVSFIVNLTQESVKLLLSKGSVL